MISALSSAAPGPQSTIVPALKKMYKLRVTRGSGPASRSASISFLTSSCNNQYWSGRSKHAGRPGRSRGRVPSAVLYGNLLYKISHCKPSVARHMSARARAAPVSVHLGVVPSTRVSLCKKESSMPATVTTPPTMAHSPVRNEEYERRVCVNLAMMGENS